MVNEHSWLGSLPFFFFAPSFLESFSSGNGPRARAKGKHDMPGATTI